MSLLSILAGIVMILVVLVDGFETIVLPRGFARKFRIVSAFYRVSWRLWTGFTRRLRSESARESALSYYGPLSLIVLLFIWGAFLIVGFALILWGVEGDRVGLGSLLYMSASTFYTLGIGDVTPATGSGRLITVAEAGLGFGFLAAVIGYLPVLYQSFSRREIAISLLDARAGSPPTAVQLLIRHDAAEGGEALDQLLHDWEHWSADLLESHISYPVLCFYRSQHERQSWISALTAILDSCALVMAGIEGLPPRQAKLTFAIARHAVVDLAAIFGIAPLRRTEPRLTAEEFVRLRAELDAAGIRFEQEGEAQARLGTLRALYEPYVEALAAHMRFSVPPFSIAAPQHDAWQTSAWHSGEHE